MIDHINTHQKSHIITIEDPIEFRFANKCSLIRQRELGTHTHSFPAAMRSCLREDPDVVMVGEMRDPETIATALALAETGHLVLSTLHTNDAVQSIDRMIDTFPAIQQSQIRFQLSMMLTAIISQTLLPHNDGKGRIVAREILLNNDAVRNTIRRGNTHQLYSIMELSTREGMMLMDSSIEKLHASNIISRETLLSRARDTDLIAKYSNS
jgi:twitching motility protein PilT